MITMLLVAGSTAAALLLLAGFLHLLAAAGPAGRRMREAACRAPALDLLILYFTVAPIVVGPIVGGWAGFLGGVLGQVVTVLVWTALHELTHPKARRGPRIVKVLNALVGPWRNHAALWVTAIVTPLFAVVRLAEVLLWPLLTRLVRFPKYDHGAWVNVSRHKFEGLVGHDLIWCLYCDWMTGVWSLGSEMLRNVESFWCPIRFASEKKCEHCRVDFPDLAGGWVRASGSMADVVAVLEEKYCDDGDDDNPWFGHPVRVTVNGSPLPGVATDQPAEATPEPAGVTAEPER